MIDLAAWFIEASAGELAGELGKALVMYAGGNLVEKLGAFLTQRERAEKLLAAFEDADKRFARTSDEYAQWIRSQPFAGIASLEKFARTLPDELDHARLHDELRRKFLDDWRGKISDAQADRAATVYENCFVRAFAVHFQNDLPILIRIADQLDHITAGMDEMIPLVRDIHGRVIGASSWRRPSAPRGNPGFIGRAQEMNEVRALLAPGTRTAITATMHGTPGVGKTWLARHLACELDAEFPGGVIAQDIGSTFRVADCAPILDEWGRRTGLVFPLDQHLSPNQIRDWFAGHPLLIVLDDIWDAAVIQPLLEAIPASATLLLTTRKRRIANDLSNLDKVYSLDYLTPDDALALLRARAKHASDAESPLLRQLAAHLGFHAQAIAIVGKQLESLAQARWQERIKEIGARVKEGKGLSGLPGSEPEERVKEVEVTLEISYAEWNERARARFRALGSFAPDASFRAEFVAAVWDCSPDKAFAELAFISDCGLLDKRADERWQQHLLLRDYALALLRQAGEEETTRRKHAEIFSNAMQESDDAQKYFVMLLEYEQLRHAFEWAIVNDVEIAQTLITKTMDLQKQFGFVRDGNSWSFQLLESAQKSANTKRLADALVIHGNRLRDLATLPGEDHAARLRESLAAYDKAITFSNSDTAPLDFAMTQNNRGLILGDLANLSGEDRAARLRESLAAFDEALRFWPPETAQPNYATAQNNRGLVLGDLANLPGEDRAARLRESLSAFDEALRFWTSETAQLHYATAQNNRGTILSDLANLFGEDHTARLRESLAAFDEALRFRRPDTAPLDYAMTQNNRGAILSDLANLSGEDRVARLRESLACYDEALRFRRPDTAPLDYAMTQNNRGAIFRNLATLPGEDRPVRLRESLACYDEALRFCRPDTAPLHYAMTQYNRGLLLSDLATLPGEDRPMRLRESLSAYNEALRFRRPDIVPLNYAETQLNLSILFAEFAKLPEENRRARLLESLRACYTALQIFLQQQHITYARQAAQQLYRISEECGDLFPALWAELQVGDVPAWLQGMRMPDALRELFEKFSAAREAAEKTETGDAWLAAAQMGEELLAHNNAARLPYTPKQWHAELANMWNHTGIVLSNERKHADALTAFDNAIQHQAGNATLHRNRAGAHIELGNFDAAEADIARATELEPEHIALNELRAELQKKRTENP
jgi:hypothetical protein